MNVKLSHDVDFSAVVVEGARIFPNSYKLKINMVTATENSIHQNVAIQRILIFIREIFNGSVLCHSKNPNASKLTKIVKDSRVILLPEEPHDQIIAMILFHKLHAIVEGNFEIDSLVIGSNISPDLTYTIDEFADFEYDNTKVEIPWWGRSDTSTTDIPKYLKYATTWADINLEWNREEKFELEFIPDMEYDNTDKPDIVVLDGGIEEE